MPLPALLIPTIGWGSAAIGAGTAATGLTSSAVSAFEPISEAFGQTERQQAENEVFDRTADPGRRINRGFGEKFFDFFTGRDQNRMEQLALEKDNKRINRFITNQGYDLQKITSALKTLNLDPSLTPKLDDNQSQASYKLELDRARNAIETAQTAQALYPEIDIAGKDVSGINLALAQAKRAEKDRNTKKSDDRYQTEVDFREQGRRDALAQQANAMTLALMQNESANRRADNQMQLQLMQQDYNNRRLDMQEARNLRQDRHKAIMQIMAGLRDMNKAFAY